MNFYQATNRKTHEILQFTVIQVLLTIIIMWSICIILTIYNVFPEGHPARTDVRIRVLQDAPWFYIPYPGQFGLPTVTIAGNFKHYIFVTMSSVAHN